MFFGLFWGDTTILVLIPAMIFAFWAQMRVNSTFKKYAKVPSRRGLTGAEAARRVLDANGLRHVTVERVHGHLTDHFDPKAGVIRLSDATYASTSVAAIGVAAHEAGHAVQYATGYSAIRLRAALIPVCQFGSYAAMPLFLVGMAVSYIGVTGGSLGYALMLAGILFYSLATLFQLVTLPVEFNASNRAMAALEGGGTMSDGELRAARQVLSAAAMTYVAALVTSLLSLLRLILIASGRRR